jgi:iron complex outermembrane receptor protein
LGSYGRREFGAAFGALSSGGVDLSFSGNWADVDGQELHYREFDDPATNHGIAQNLDWERYHSILGTCSAGGLSIQGYFSKREKGIPTAPWETVFNDGDARTLDRAAHADIRYERALGATKVVSFRGYLDHYYYTGAYPYEILWLDEYNGVWTGGDFRLRWDPRPNNRLILGAEYQNHLRARYRAWDSEGVHFDGSNAYSLVSLYAQDEYQATTNLSITGGLRTDHYSHAGTTTSLRGAIVYNARRSGTFKLLYGEAFRAPNVAELYYHDETAKGNPDLLPETIRTIEGVWERRLTEGLYGAVSVYGYRMKDLIDMTEDPSDGLIQYRNINTVRAAGVEVELTFRFKEKGRGYASYSYQRAEDKVSGQTLSNSPAHLVRAGASIPMGRRVAVVPELQYEGERKTVQNTKIEGYFLTSLNLSFSPRSDRPGSALLDHVELSLQVRNALDRKYATPGGFEHVQPAIAQNGRNYAVRFELGF